MGDRRCLIVFEPPDGGVAENVLQLCLGLRGEGWEPWAAGPLEPQIASRLFEAGVPLARLPLRRGYGAPAADLQALRRLIGILRGRHFDLLHAHSAKAGVLGRAAALVTNTPAVYSPHCFPFVGPWAPPRRLFSLTVEKALGRGTAGLVCVAEAERELAAEHGIARRQRRHLVHNGAPACSPEVEPRADLRKFAEGGPLAACIAVLRPQKGVHTFVEAAPRVLERLPQARLAVVGDGPERERLEARARELRLPSDRFRFFGYEPPAARQLLALDLFVLPSSWEAFPIAVLEAMSCGVPQVATDVGGTREALADGETGLLCPPDDPRALAGSIVELLAVPERRARMGARARERFQSRFTLDRMIRATAEVYSAALSTRPGG